MKKIMNITRVLMVALGMIISVYCSIMILMYYFTFSSGPTSAGTSDMAMIAGYVIFLAMLLLSLWWCYKKSDGFNTLVR